MAALEGFRASPRSPVHHYMAIARRRCVHPAQGWYRSGTDSVYGGLTGTGSLLPSPGSDTHPFTAEWRFAFRLNTTLPRSQHRDYTQEERDALLKSMVDISWPLQEPWTEDLFTLLASAPDLGEVISEGDEDEPAVVRLPGSDDVVVVDQKLF